MSKNVIIINKMFKGTFLNDENNIGHEIVDFIKADNGNLYAYNLPYGQIRNNIYVSDEERTDKRNVNARWLVLTSGFTNSKFDILYVIELEEIVLINKDTNKLYSRDEFNKYIINNNIKYDGMTLNDIYKGEIIDKNPWPVTFKCKRIYRANTNVTVEDFKGNPGHNNRYIYDSNDYELILNKILVDGSISPNFDEYIPSKVNEIKDEFNETFLDLTGNRYNELSLSSILYNLLSYKDMMNKFIKYIYNIEDNNNYNIYKEYEVKDDKNKGRIDILALSTNSAVVIENKIHSGLNGDKNNGTQLTTYYNAISGKYSNAMFIITCPDYQSNIIKDEINKISDNNVKNSYKIVLYSKIAEFINNNNYEGFKYSNYINEIINIFNSYKSDIEKNKYASIFKRKIDKLKSKE